MKKIFVVLLTLACVATVSSITLNAKEAKVSPQNTIYAEPTSNSALITYEFYPENGETAEIITYDINGEVDRQTAQPSTTPPQNTVLVEDLTPNTTYYSYLVIDGVTSATYTSFTTSPATANGQGLMVQDNATETTITMSYFYSARTDNLATSAYIELTDPSDASYSQIIDLMDLESHGNVVFTDLERNHIYTATMYEDDLELNSVECFTTPINVRPATASLSTDNHQNTLDTITFSYIYTMNDSDITEASIHIDDATTEDVVEPLTVEEGVNKVDVSGLNEDTVYKIRIMQGDVTLAAQYTTTDHQIKLATGYTDVNGVGTTTVDYEYYYNSNEEDNSEGYLYTYKASSADPLTDYVYRTPAAEGQHDVRGYGLESGTSYKVSLVQGSRIISTSNFTTE